MTSNSVGWYGDVCGRVRRLEDLGVAVIDRDLGDVDPATQELVHIGVLLDDRDVLVDVDAGGDGSGHHLELVAGAEHADAVTRQVGRTRDTGVAKRDRQRRRATEDLADVDEIGRAGRLRLEHARHPADGELGPDACEPTASGKTSGPPSISDTSRPAAS